MHPDILELLHCSADFIVQNQLPGGDIPWFEGGKTDPWDLTECAIALDICGRHEQSRKAYLWLCEIQNPDGSWWYSYMNGEPHERAKDTNYSTYIVVGVWCHYLATADKAFLEQVWPSVEKALDFAVRLQQPEGHIHWGMDEFGNIWDEALIAGSSCVWLSLRCGLRIAGTLNIPRPEWEEASNRLAAAIRNRPELFESCGFSKCDYALSWFYPVLTGVVNGDQGKVHLMDRWDDFVIEPRGCKCVVAEPWWVTVAETAELSMALIRVGERHKAEQLLKWTLELQAEPGVFWAGIKIPEEMIWPEEKPTWVAAALIIAASAYLDEKNKLAAVLWGRFEE